MSHRVDYRWVTYESQVILQADESHARPGLCYRWVINESHMGHTLSHKGLRWVTDESCNES